MHGSNSTRRLRWAILLVGVAVVLLGAFTGYQALRARDALQATATDLQQLRGTLAGGDTQTARELVSSAQESAAEARENTRGPGWWVASRLPRFGDDVVGVQTVADVVDDLASGVLPNVVDASASLSPERLRPTNGRIDLGAIAGAAPAVTSADRDVRRAQARAATLEPDDMVGGVAGPVRELQDGLRDAARLTEKASRAVRLLPPMLGAEGRRTYLVLFQNNAEIRATGGLPGALAVVTADNGRIAMSSQGRSADLGAYDTPALPLTRQERALFDDKMGTFPQDSNFTPDFPRTAELVRAMWKRAQGQSVDGVLSTDPVALSHVLAGTGPVSLAGPAGLAGGLARGLARGQQLTADNAVQVLLNTVYLEQPDPVLQDRFFASTARQVFEAVASGTGDPRKVIDGLARSAAEHRLLVWSADPAEQELITPTPLSGALPTGGSDRPQIGVYLNDGTGAKMHYYVDHRADVESLSCQDGVQKLKVTFTMRSNAPADARRLPVSVIGPGFGAPPGSVRTGVLLYAPTGGHVVSATLDGAELASATQTHEGRPVAAQTIDLAPGDEVTLEFIVAGDQGQTGDVDLRVTPGAHGSGVGTVGPSSCS